MVFPPSRPGFNTDGKYMKEGTKTMKKILIAVVVIAVFVGAGFIWPKSVGKTEKNVANWVYPFGNIFKNTPAAKKQIAKDAANTKKLVHGAKAKSCADLGDFAASCNAACSPNSERNKGIPAKMMKKCPASYQRWVAHGYHKWLKCAKIKTKTKINAKIKILEA